MKKILGISLCALFAVSAANANIASQEYVDEQVGNIDLSGIQTNAGDIADLNTTITNMDADRTAGQYVTYVSQADGKVTAEGASFAGDVTTGATNAPTSNAVVTYVGTNAVQKVITGQTNGTIKVDDTEVAVAGLGSAAYTSTDAYATASQGTKADSAVQKVITGETNGTIIVDGQPVSVGGLKAMAYEAAVTTDNITNGTIMDADINAGAKIASTKIQFTEDEADVFESGINRETVAQITTNKTSINDLKGYLTPTGNCVTNPDGCTLVYTNGTYSWEAIKR